MKYTTNEKWPAETQYIKYTSKKKRQAKSICGLPTTPPWGGAPGRLSLVWLWCGGHTEVGLYIGSDTERSDRHWVTLDLCVMIMGPYNLGERGLMPTARQKRQADTSSEDEH